MATISLVARVSAQIAEFQKSFDDAKKTASDFADSFEGIATRAAAVGTFIGNAALDIAKSLAGAFSQALQDSVRLSSEFNNAFIGLGSVARAFGTDADVASAAAKRLSSDGLLPLKDAATGLKNLLAAGFNLEQSVQLMNAFKDSAAFGRQSALSFGDAVRSATEGVKNGNSILVDNAGVTKNLSQILKEAGFSAQDLSRASSDAGVRMALFNGILRETVAQTGDAERLTQTYAGQVAKLSATYDNLLANLGDAITTNATVARAIGIVGDAFLRLSQHLSNNKRAFDFVSEAVIIFVKGLATAVGVVDVAQRAFNDFVIGVNNVVGALVSVATAAFKLVEQAENIQRFTDPVRWQQHTKAAEEARQAYQFLEGVTRTLGESTKKAQQDSREWSGHLGSLQGALIGVAGELTLTKGKTVDLGTAAGATGSALGNEFVGNTKKAKDALEKLQTVIDKSTNSLRLGLQSIPGIEIDLKKLVTIIPPEVPDLRAKIVQGFEGLSNLPGTEIDLGNFIPPLKPTFFQKFFGEDFGQQLGNIFGNALRGGGVINAIADASGLIGSTLMKGLADKLTTGTNAITGWLGGMISSALPVIGSLVGPLVEKIAGMFGNRGRDLVKDFAASFGGFDALHERLLEMGAAGEALWIKLTQGVGRNNPEQARAVIAEVEAALNEFGTEAERAAARMEGIGTAIEGINAKATLFAAPFQALIDKQKEGKITQDEFTASLAALGEKGQAEFERIGLFAAAAFAGMVKETGDAIGALDRLGPALGILKQGVTDFGLTSTGTIDALVGLFDLVHDQTTGPILQAIQATGQIFAGLQDAGILTSELFQTVSDDIGAAFRELEAKGGDVSKAMALSQPVLQRLWEAQQKYGEVTDETTRKLLQQAEEQGLVGDHMKDVNQKILDVLLAIADVFGAKIPDSMRNTRDAASQTSTEIENNFRDAGRSIEDSFRNAGRGAARGIEDEFKNIKVNVPIVFEPGDWTTPPPYTPSVPHMAHGGLVRRPTLALIGEAGPEVVIPLNKLGSFAPDAGSTTIELHMDGRDVADIVVPHLPGKIRRLVRV